MTAVTVVAGENSAYLLADGAGFYDDGTIARILSKIYTLDHLSLAIAFSGILPDGLPEWFSEQTDQISLLAGLPDMLREEIAYHHAAKAKFPESYSQVARAQIAMHLFVALWSHEDQEPQAYIIASEDHNFEQSYEPYTVRRVHAVESPGVDPALRPPVKAKNADWALPVIKHQRRTPVNGQCRVGAFAELVTVGPERIDRKIIHRWRMDKVGRKARSMRRPTKSRGAR